MGIRYAKLFEAPKSMDVTLESVATVTDHFADAFVRENVARVYMTLWLRNDVRKFDADAILF